MKYVTSKRFDKNFSKLDKKIKEKAIKQMIIFTIDPTDIHLNNHALNGKWINCRSINITSDIRAIYKLIDKDTARFIDIGSHSNLYE